MPTLFKDKTANKIQLSKIPIELIYIGMKPNTRLIIYPDEEISCRFGVETKWYSPYWGGIVRAASSIDKIVFVQPV
jgi:hypothetical protein